LALGSTPNLSPFGIASDVGFRTVGVERDLRQLEHLQQFRVAAEQPAQQQIEHRALCSQSEGAIEAGAQFDPRSAVDSCRYPLFSV